MKHESTYLDKLALAAAREVCRRHLAAWGADEPEQCPDGCPAAGDCPLGCCSLQVRLRPGAACRSPGDLP